MKQLLAGLLAGITIISCTTAKKLDPEKLPRDISQYPVKPRDGRFTLEQEGENLRRQLSEIQTLANSQNCTNVAEWRISPVGSKACGGPATYIAYHISVENEIIPMIQEYTRRQAHYNMEAGILSDCALVPQPSGLRCDNGRAVLIKGNSSVETAAQ